MKVASVPSARRGAVVLAMVVALAGCTATKASPETVYVTPIPTATVAATHTVPPTQAPTATPTPAPTLAPTPTEAPTDTPAPTAAPTSVAAACTGTADHKAFFADAAHALHFNVYCAVLPKGWWLQEGKYEHGALFVYYKNSAGAGIELNEGSFCADPSTCLSGYPTLGAGSFGDMAGTLHLMNPTPTYGIFVNVHSTPAYAIMGVGLTQAKFVQIAAALHRVPKP
jgi:hypothetical protein